MKNAVVIGAGIVGLHVAACLQDRGWSVLVLDAAPYLAEHTSGRNSGVIHSGVFYQSGSLKEKTCLEGNQLTYEWLQKLEVPYLASGKWVVPEPGQEGELLPFYERLLQMKIAGVQLFEKSEMQKQEPALCCSDAVLIPTTGVLDAAAYVKAMSHYVQERGADVVLQCKVKSFSGNSLETTRGPIEYDLCVNSAGLNADEMAEMAGLSGYTIRPCRGDYYILPDRPVKRPVYHLPYQGAQGLGIHLTTTVDGSTLFGPNAFMIEKKDDYAHHSDRTAYEQALLHYLPGLDAGRLRPAYSGNRPKLFYRGQAMRDFVIQKQGDVIHLLGIESPGLTASPALARAVVDMI